MLDKLDISVNNRFRHLIFCGIEFHFIQGRGCTHFINGFIQKIPGARFDFPDRPAIPAYIIAGHKAAIRSGSISVDQFAITEDPIGRPCKRGIPLSISGVSITLYHMDAKFLQNIAEMYRRSLPAFNGHVLCGRGHIAVHRKFFYQIGSRQELLFNLAVFSGRNFLIDFISQNVRTGDMEGDTGNNAVLTGLDKFCGTVSFRFEFYKEGNRIAGAGHHGLVAGSAPDQHVVCHRDILSEFKQHRVHHHLPAGKGVFISVSCHRNAAAFQSLQIDLQVIGICDRQGIDLFFYIPFQFQFRCFAFLRRSKGRYCGMGSDLCKNPVIGFFCRSSGDHAEILVGVCVAVSVAAVRIASKLLLVFPKDDLGCHLIVILVDSGNRERRTGFPAIDRSQGDPPPCLGRKQVQVLAVGPAFRNIGIFRSMVRNPALHTVNLVADPVRIRQHIVPVSIAPGTGVYIDGSVCMVGKIGVRRRGTVVVPIRAHILVAQPGACRLSDRHGKSLSRNKPQNACHTKQKRQQLAKAAASGYDMFHEKILTFIKSKRTALFAVLVVKIILGKIFRFPVCLIRVKAFAITVILKFRIVLGLLFRTHDFYIVTDPADRK